jgi:hypothetical protein
MIGQGVGAGPGDIFIFETADPVELRLVQPIQQRLEFRLGLAGEADDEGRTQRDIGADAAPRRDLVKRARRGGGPPSAG